MNIAARLGRHAACGGLELGLRLAQQFHTAASRLMARRPGGLAPRAAAPPSASRLSSILRCVERSLDGNILPFCALHAPDERDGGFIAHLDRAGGRLGPTDKYLVFQARMIRTLAAAHRYGLANRGYLELAGEGVRFLTDRMWDTEHAGFFWTVRRAGSPLKLEKRVYGQAFAMYALAEYGIAAGNPQALTWAGRVFDLLVEKAADGPFGFREEFARDWMPAPGPAGQRKTVNTHLHIMEALMTLIEASRQQTHAAALAQIVEVLLQRAIHPRDCYAWDAFDRTWQPETIVRPPRISYGHEVELAWMLFDATDILGQPREAVRDLLLGLIDHALAYGFDHVRGGVAQYGPPVGSAAHAVYLPPDRLTKMWWQQAEMLVATLEAYRWTGSAGYLAAFEKQFDWIWRHQMDHDGGDWFAATTWREGRPLGSNKGHAWKDPYHNARALMKASQGLRALGVLMDAGS